MIDGYSRSSGLSGSAILNSTSMRDESSGSEDNVESQSVQFYLGNAPSSTISASAVSTPAMTQRTPLATPAVPLDGLNHVGAVNNQSNVNASAAAADSATMIHDANRHSPSVSSERSDRSSIVVPPRTKKANHSNPNLSLALVTTTVATATSPTSSISSPSPPSGVGPVGRAPLPPPRKSNQSPLLRSQSSDLMPDSVRYNLLARPQQQAQPAAAQQIQSLIKGGPNNNGSAPTASKAGGNKSKRMVKQHSTASQQSTSSTSSSVQSAPEHGSSSKQQSPSRFSTSSLERQILPQHLQQHNFKPPKTVTPMTFPSLDRDFLSSVSTLQSAGSLKSEELLLASQALDNISMVSDSYHSDTQLHTVDNNGSDTAVSVKKRKKGLRFGFGSKKSQSSSSDTSSSKSKNT
ncbi:uncharacterized protein LOC106082017 [Stomoxys calcitrans]|uniref:uncharacterized protein LOC106082017 n=1 Tax=Stomoxys calcitrans TaxID=35570 RepID=UPI0027E27D1D|nr:uncharacterized protein LOC106082017 [Stomoxys calcitrans]XP_059222475.1 uncharacterized protein LOC106082017 [Stomoxys calcitrans]